MALQLQLSSTLLPDGELLAIPLLALVLQQTLRRQGGPCSCTKQPCSSFSSWEEISAGLRWPVRTDQLCGEQMFVPALQYSPIQFRWVRLP